jgi:hypothetical protein
MFFVKRSAAPLAVFALAVAACSGADDDDTPDTVGLCYRISGNVLSTSCSGGNRGGTCRTAGTGYRWYYDYSSFTTCGAAASKLRSDWSKGIAPKPPSGGSSSGGGSSVDCVRSCPSEFSDVQLDSFCRQACCLSLTGQTSNAAATCRAGASLGTSRCRYCD